MRIRARRGFTLAEVVVAVVLVNAGLLAITGATAIVVWRQTELRARGAAIVAASNRLRQLAATPCQRRSGVVTALLTERWSEDAPLPHIRELRDTVSFSAFGATHVVVLTTRLPC